MLSSTTLNSTTNNNVKKNSTPSIFFISSDSNESKTDLDEFIELFYEKLSLLLNNFKLKSVYLDKSIKDNLKRIINSSKLNQITQVSVNLYSMKMLSASVKLSKKTLETNQILEDLLLNIDARTNTDTLNITDLIESQRNHHAHSPHYKLNNTFLANLTTIESLIHKQIECIKTSDQMHKDNEINKEFNLFLDKLVKIVNEERREFIIDLCLAAFDYTRIAKLILESFEFNQLAGNQEDQPIKSSRNLKYIKFSSQPISTEPIINEFNKNIISIRLNRILETPANLKLNKNQATKCHKCSAYLSYFTQIKESKWTCDICNESNNGINATVNHFDVEYSEQPEIIQTNSKIIVFCIDLSRSMSGKRIDAIKVSCIKNLISIKQENPEYKVALITFTSNAIYHGHGTLNERINLILEDWQLKNNLDSIKTASSDLLPIKDSFQKLENKINSLTTSAGTSISEALAYSCVLASSVDNSEVVLCTDGLVEDKNELFYESIAKYCNTNGLVKISLVSFEDSDCDLVALCKLTSSTKRKQSNSIDQFKFEEFYNEIIEESLKNNSQIKVNLHLLGDYDLIDLDKKSYHFELQNIDQSERELLIEFNLLNEKTDKDHVYFQIQLITKTMTRVLTTRIQIRSEEKVLNSELIHAYSIRRLLNISLDENDLKRAKSYLNEYSKFSKQNNETITETVKTNLDLVENLANNETGVEMLMNKKVNSFEFKHKKTETKLIKLTNLIQTNNKEIATLIDLNKKGLEMNLDDDDVLNDYSDFNNKLENLFDSFNLNDKFTEVRNEKFVKKLYVAVELLEQAFNLLKCLKHSRKQTHQKPTHHNSIMQQSSISLAEEMLTELSDMEILYSNFNSVCNLATNWIFKNEPQSEALLQELSEFVMNPINDTHFNSIRCLNIVASQLVRKARHCAMNSVLHTEIKNKDIEFKFIIESQNKMTENSPYDD